MDSIIDVPLVKPFIYFYSAWYPFILINTFIIYLYDKGFFKCLIATMLISAFFAQITFIVYPTEVIRPTIEVHNLTDWLLNFNYTGDNPPVNCLPSMHCVYCFVVSFYIYKCKKLKYRYWLILFSLLIVVSTLFVKQHIVEDIILSFIYTAITLIIVNLNKEKILNIFEKLKL